MASKNVLLTLFLLSQKARQANVDELRYLLANATRDMVSFSHAAIVETTNPDTPFFVSALSNASEVDQSSPYVDAVKRVYLAAKAKYGKTASSFSLSDLFKKKESSELKEWLPEDLIYVPLSPPKVLNSQWQGELLLAREKAFSDSEKELLQTCAEIFAHAFGAFHTISWWRQTWSDVKRSVKARWKWYVSASLFLLIPLPNTVIAPAEVVAQKPSLVRSSLDGVIEIVHVEPGQLVKKDAPILTFDTKSLQTNLALSHEEERVASQQLRQLQQQVLMNNAERFKLANARGKLEEAKARKRYVQEQLSRSTIYAPQEGVVIFEKGHDLLGMPVSVGEKLMYLASPAASELEIQLPIYQAIAMPDDADIRFFTNINPHLPKDAQLKYHSYRAHESSNGEMAYRLKASWNEDVSDLRIGLKGNAKIYGYYSPIIWKLIRPPLYHMRKWLGW